MKNIQRPEKPSGLFRNHIKLAVLYKIIITGFIAGALCLLWGFLIEPNLLFIKKYQIKSAKLSRLKVVFISDIHASKRDSGRIEKIVEKSNLQKPDLIILGGDFINGHSEKSSLSVDIIAKKLSKLEARYGIFSVLGNHDWYLDGHAVRHELEKVGIIVLENENTIVNINGTAVTIAGIADDTTRKPDIDKTLKGSSDTIIFITHSPDVFPNISKDTEIVLAGHTHGGQVVIPFYGAPITNSFYGQKYRYGLVNENNKTMIITGGIGTSVLPVRFFAPPEIVAIDFK